MNGDRMYRIKTQTFTEEPLDVLHSARVLLESGRHEVDRAELNGLEVQAMDGLAQDLRYAPGDERYVDGFAALQRAEALTSYATLRERFAEPGMDKTAVGKLRDVEKMYRDRVDQAGLLDIIGSRNLNVVGYIM